MKITLIYLFMFDLPLILTGRIALLRARIFTLARPLKLRLRRDFSFSQKIWNFKQVSKIKRKEMNFHENDIRNIPSGFRSQCEIRNRRNYLSTKEASRTDSTKNGDEGFSEITDLI